MKQAVMGLCALGLAVAAAPAISGDYVLPTEPKDMERYYSPGFEKCLKATHGSRDTELCSLAERDLQVKKLDAAYARRLAAAKGPARAALKADQAAWRAASDADCHHHSGHGRWGAIAFVACGRENAMRRRLQLERGAR